MLEKCSTIWYADTGYFSNKQIVRTYAALLNYLFDVYGAPGGVARCYVLRGGLRPANENCAANLRGGKYATGSFDIFFCPEGIGMGRK